MNKSAQRGFTLIELVVVIVILGILAAFAVPRFANLDRQARIASLRSMEGAIRSGATMARAQWLAEGQPANGVLMQGSRVRFTNGYPTTATVVNVLDAGAINAATPGKYRQNGAGIFQLNGSTDPTVCRVTYAEPAAVDAAPVIALPTAAQMNTSC